jgi:YMGG-like Gly-zipper
MMTAARRAIIAVVASAFAAAPAAAEVFVYPKAGQSQERFQQDQFECHSWAKGQTGVDPSQSYASASPPTAPQSGGVVRGGARGAAVGAIGGAIGGDAGKGAAIGAATGAAVGGIRQRSANQQAAAANQQAQAQHQANLQRYEQAYAACMSGRNYQVK